MAIRPKNRGFSRKVFELLETKGPMSRSTIAEEMRKMESPTPDVKTPETEELRPVESFTVPLPVQVVGMVLLTAIVTAVSTAIAIRIF